MIKQGINPMMIVVMIVIIIAIDHYLYTDIVCDFDSEYDGN